MVIDRDGEVIFGIPRLRLKRDVLRPSMRPGPWYGIGRVQVPGAIITPVRLA